VGKDGFSGGIDVMDVMVVGGGYWAMLMKVGKG
jgi:hypothetical protein